MGECSRVYFHMYMYVHIIHVHVCMGECPKAHSVVSLIREISYMYRAKVSFSSGSVNKQGRRSRSGWPPHFSTHSKKKRRLSNWLAQSFTHT